MSRSRPGRSARLDTRTYQTSTNPVLRKLAFQRLVMQLAEELPKADLGLQSAAITTLQEVTENYLNDILKEMRDNKGSSSLANRNSVAAESRNIHIVKAEVHNVQDPDSVYNDVPPNEPIFKCASCKQTTKNLFDYSVYDPEDTMLSVDLDQTVVDDTIPTHLRESSIDFTLLDDDFFSIANDSHENVIDAKGSLEQFRLKEGSTSSVFGLKTAMLRLFLIPDTVTGVKSFVKRLHKSLGRMSAYFTRR